MTLEAVKTYHRLHPDDQLILVGRKEEFAEASSFAKLVNAPDVIEMEALMKYPVGTTTGTLQEP